MKLSLRRYLQATPLTDPDMLLYHPYVFSFCYGFSLITCITSVSLNIMTIFLFNEVGMIIYLMLMDLIILTVALSGRFLSLTSIYWIFNATLGALNTLLFSMYFYIRCYPMMSKKEKRIGHIGFPITFVGLLFYLLGARGFLVSNFIASMIFLSITPYMFSFTSFILIKIIRMIKRNPIYMYSGKQTRLMLVSNYTAFFIYLYCIPTGMLSMFGTLFEQNWSIDVSTASCTLILIVAAISNFTLTANKYYEDAQLGATGSNVFHT